MKIGLVGGTFNPIHFGHIRPALEVKDQLQLDEIWLMPNAMPPHKSNGHITNRDKVNMVNMVCKENHQFALCDIEINQDNNLNNQPNYTVNTIKALQDRYPNNTFSFIMGADSLIHFNTWYQWQSLLDLCHFSVCQRPQWQINLNQLPLEIKQRISTSFLLKYGQISLIKVTQQPYSSTEIRQSLKNITAHRNFLSQALPKQVLKYIKQHKLYE